MVMPEVTEEALTEVLGLVLAVAMQCEQRREVITQITEMDEAVMNELQIAYEHVVEHNLGGMGPALDVSRILTTNSNNISGIDKQKSVPIGEK